MLSDFTVYDDNFAPDDEDEADDDEDTNFESEYLKNYVFQPDREYMYRCQKALTELRNSLELEGIRSNVIDCLFEEGLKVLFAACFVDTYLEEERNSEVAPELTEGKTFGEATSPNPSSPLQCPPSHGGHCSVVELTNFEKVIVILKDEAREREARLQIVEKRFKN